MYLQVHKMVGFAYIILDSQNKVHSYKTYLAKHDDDDAVEKFYLKCRRLGLRFVVFEGTAEEILFKNAKCTAGCL